MSTTSEEIPELLKNLRLHKMAAIIETELAAARKGSPSLQRLPRPIVAGRVAESAGEEITSANQTRNKDLSEALLSRLRHQCQTIRINGPSLREPQG